MAEFVLERVENPHPKMVTRALAFRACAGRGQREWWRWEGYLQAMCDATGESREAMLAWLDRSEP